MAPSPPDGRQRVAVVSGGGGGIGAAIAEELGRTGAFVVTLDPMVSVDGSEQQPSAEDTTADRIVAAGGAARASSASVTDRQGVARLFTELADELGGLDVVVNVAGITRPTSFTRGSEEDWRAVLAVHLDGYRNVLDAALPIMAAAGQGHILGVTSGSGWRAADAGAYGCAKRAVASLTWQVGRHAPPGVVVNAISPIAMTRMVTAALGRSRPTSAPPSTAPSTASTSTGGLSLGAMPSPDQLGPLAAHLVGEGFSGCRGQVVFTAGSEAAVIDPPRLLEVVGTEGLAPLAPALEALTRQALVPAEAGQQSGGGSNARFASLRDEVVASDLADPAIRSCVVVAERGDVADAVISALGERGVVCSVITAHHGTGFEAAASMLAASDEGPVPVDAVVVAQSGDGLSPVGGADWERILAEHVGVVDGISFDAGWARAVADLSTRADRPIRLVTLTDAVTAGGRSRAQAAAQLARAARRATDDRVTAFAVSVEGGDGGSVGEVTAHLLCSPETPALSGAELVVDAGVIGLRSHPRVRASLVLGGPTVPDWLDDALGGIVG